MTELIAHSGVWILAIVMIVEFGEQYRAYKARTPMFFPGKSQWRQFLKLSQRGSENARNEGHYQN